MPYLGTVAVTLLSFSTDNAYYQHYYLLHLNQPAHCSVRCPLANTLVQGAVTAQFAFYGVG